MISIQADRPKHSFRNATDLNAMIDDLRPNTEYEFTVKVQANKKSKNKHKKVEKQENFQKMFSVKRQFGGGQYVRENKKIKV